MKPLANRRLFCSPSHDFPLLYIVFYRKICYSNYKALICKIGGHAFRPARCFTYMEWSRGSREENFFVSTRPGALKAKGGRNAVNLTELLALLMFILGLLTLIVEVIRLTFEVTTFYQKQEHENKKDWPPSYQLVQSIFLTSGTESWPLADQRPFCL